MDRAQGPEHRRRCKTSQKTAREELEGGGERRLYVVCKTEGKRPPVMPCKSAAYGVLIGKGKHKINGDLLVAIWRQEMLPFFSSLKYSNVETVVAP